MRVLERAQRLSHPRELHVPVIAGGLVAMACWMLSGVPYSLTAWLLDEQQTRWALSCYAWEVPVIGLVGPFLLPVLWREKIARQWDRVFAAPTPDRAEVARLEQMLLDHPLQVALVLPIASVIGYGIAAVQLRWFADTPSGELVKISLMGFLAGVIVGLLTFLYLEWLLGALLRRLATVRGTEAPAGRRMALHHKVFGCSAILTLTSVLLLGTIFYSRGERILEQQIGTRIATEARALAHDIVAHGGGGDADWWTARRSAMRLGPSGQAFVVDARGKVVDGGTTLADLHDAGFRPSTVAEILALPSGRLVDRRIIPRIVAFEPLGVGARRVVVVVHRYDFASELNIMLQRGGIAVLLSLLVALFQAILLSRGIVRPVEEVTAQATAIARSPRGPWARLPVLANDEGGQLAVAFNRMIEQLEDARRALERHSTDLEARVAGATRDIAMLYDVMRATTATLEPRDVLAVVADKTLAALRLSRCLLLRVSVDTGRATEAHIAVPGDPPRAIELTEPIDVDAFAAREPTLVPRAGLPAALPPEITAPLACDAVLVLPLVFQERLLALFVADADRPLDGDDLRMAAAVAAQGAVAVANATLFERARQHEAELQELHGFHDQVQDETLRTLSRELHDGIGQTLTGIKLDLGAIERTPPVDRDVLRARLRELRDQVNDVLQEVRSMSQLLRPSVLDDFGLVHTIEWLAERFRQRTGVAVRLATPPSETRLPPAIEVMLYRVTQEALANVVHHAKATRVDIDLAVGATEVRLSIADDGVGFDPEQVRRRRRGLGLLGMRERIAYHRGRIDIRSRPGGGVRIELAVPADVDAPAERLHG